MKEKDVGQKRDIEDDDWGELAKRIRTSAQARTDIKSDEEAMDTTEAMRDIDEVIRKPHVDESKITRELLEVAKEFEAEDDLPGADEQWGAEELYEDSRTREKLDRQKVQSAREEEIRELERRVYVTVDIQECWEKTGKALEDIGFRGASEVLGDRYKHYRDRLLGAGAGG